MGPADLDLQRLDIFVRIVDAGSMSAAARLVHLTQPALSRNLKLLEDAVGAPLFERERGGRHMVLTAAGRALLPRARALLGEAGRLLHEVGRIAARGYFDLRLGTVDSVATYLLPHVVEPLRAAFPELRTRLRTARSAHILAQLRAGELDVGILAWSGTPPDLPSARVAPYNLQFYGRADRFGALADARTDVDVKAFPVVEIEALPGQPTMITEAASSFAVAGSLASVKAMVMAGFGVGALLDFMLSPAEARTLVRARVPHDPDCALHLLTPPREHGEAEVRMHGVLVEALRRALEGTAGGDGDGSGRSARAKR